MPIQISKEDRDALVQGKISIDELVKQKTERIKAELTAAKEEEQKKEDINRLKEEIAAAKKQVYNLRKIALPDAIKAVKDLQEVLRKFKYGEQKPKRRK